MKPGVPRLSTIRTASAPRARSVLAGIAIVVAVIACAVGLGVLGYLWYLSGTISFGDSPAAQQLHSALAGSSQQSNNLLIAVTSDATPGGPSRTGTLVLVHVDAAGHRVWQLWIPPDIKLPLQDHGYGAIADAHLYGGPAGTVRAVKTLTGLPVNQYLEVSPDAIRQAIDFAGGIWANVPAAINTTAAVGTGAPVVLTPGWQQLTGSKALAFALTTSTVDPTYASIANQGLVVDALTGALAARSGSLPSLIARIAPLLKTTLGLNDLVSKATAIGSAGSAGVYRAVVIGQRQPQLITPDPKSLSRLIADIRAEKPFDVPQAALAAAAANAATPASSERPSQITVTVNNGSGLSGAAKQAAGLLQTQGFVITSTGNANLNVYKQTLIVYKDDVGAANLVARYLPPGTKIVRSYGLYSFKSAVLVVIGKDWDITKAPVVPVLAQ